MRRAAFSRVLHSARRRNRPRTRGGRSRQTRPAANPPLGPSPALRLASQRQSRQDLQYPEACRITEISKISRYETTPPGRMNYPCLRSLHTAVFLAREAQDPDPSDIIYSAQSRARSPGRPGRRRPGPQGHGGTHRSSLIAHRSSPATAADEQTSRRARRRRGRRAGESGESEYRSLRETVIWGAPRASAWIYSFSRKRRTRSIASRVAPAWPLAAPWPPSVSTACMLQRRLQRPPRVAAVAVAECGVHGCAQDRERDPTFREPMHACREEAHVRFPDDGRKMRKAWNRGETRAAPKERNTGRADDVRQPCCGSFLLRALDSGARSVVYAVSGPWPRPTEPLSHWGMGSSRSGAARVPCVRAGLRASWWC